MGLPISLRCEVIVRWSSENCENLNVEIGDFEDIANQHTSGFFVILLVREKLFNLGLFTCVPINR